MDNPLPGPIAAVFLWPVLMLPLDLLMLFFIRCAFQKDLDLLFSFFYSHQNTEPRDSRVYCDGSRCRALGDHPAPPPSLRGQECTLRVCALQASPGPGMRCFPACHRLLHHHQGRITAKASDPVCPASYRKTVGLNAHELKCVWNRKVEVRGN